MKTFFRRGGETAEPNRDELLELMDRLSEALRDAEDELLERELEIAFLRARVEDAGRGPAPPPGGQPAGSASNVIRLKRA